MTLKVSKIEITNIYINFSNDNLISIVVMYFNDVY